MNYESSSADVREKEASRAVDNKSFPVPFHVTE